MQEHWVTEKDSMSDVSVAAITDPFWLDNLIDCVMIESDAEVMEGERDTSG